MKSNKFDYKQAVEFLAAREAAEKAECRRLLLQAREDFSAIVGMIINDYEPVKIYQWGSLLNPEDFDEISDIDIAVEGLQSAEQFFELYDKAAAMTEFPLDLVEIEKISEVHRKAIIEHGRVVYEKR